MEAYGLGQRLDIPTDEAARDPRRVLRGVPERRRRTWPRRSARRRQRGYTTTLFGRRRQIPELSSDNFRIRQMGERMAQNAPVQGSAADIFKLAMIDLDRALDERGLASRGWCSPCTTSSCSRCPLGERDATEALVREAMEHVTELRVPLVVDIGFGPTWADAK